MVEVPEYVVTKAAAYSGANSNFDKMISVANEYRAANMTPFFLYDEEKQLLYCFARETYNKKNLH